MTQTVSISFFRFPHIAGRFWAFGQMLAARRPLKRLPGIGFHKLFGTGTGEGFDPAPNTAVWAVLATWPSLAEARDQTQTAPVFTRYRHRSAESWTVYLSALHARGAWDGQAPFQPAPPPREGPVAVLTRASVRPRHVLRFWRQVPDINGAIQAQTALRFKIGMGEVPWLHQVTFSIWDDPGAMRRFARGGPHGEAVRSVRAGDWFSEELYAHFAVTGCDDGHWEGRHPLPALAHSARALGHPLTA